MLSTTALDRRTLQWFATLPRRTAAEGHRRPHTHGSRLLHLRCSTASVDPIFLHRASCCVRARTLNRGLLVGAQDVLVGPQRLALEAALVEVEHDAALGAKVGIAREDPA